MESPLRTVGNSPAQKEIPESAIVDNDTITVPVGSENVIIASDYEVESGIDRYNHLEQEFRVLKGSIKKLIVDIREQMNNSENPFVNIQQMMPAQSSIVRNNPIETERPPRNNPEPEMPAVETATAAAEKKVRDNNPPSQDTGERCPASTGSAKTGSRCPLSDEHLSQDDIRQIVQLLLAALNQGNSELCYGQRRKDQQPERNAFHQAPYGCPAGLNAIPPCGMPADPGRGIRCPGQPVPCMPQCQAGMQGRAFDSQAIQGSSSCPYPDGPQMYGPRPYGCDYCQPRVQGNRENSPYNRPGYAGYGWNQQAQPDYRQQYDGQAGQGGEHLRNGSPEEGAREPGMGRQEPEQRSRRAHQPAEGHTDNHCQRPTYDDHELSARDRPARTPGKSHRKSLDSWTDDGFIDPEPEPVVIEIPKPVSARKKRSARARSVPDMVVVDVEPENVVPPSIRSSRRRGL